MENIVIENSVDSKGINLAVVHDIKFPDFGKKRGNVLILGFFDGVIGDSSATNITELDYNATSYNNLAIVRNALKSKNNLTIISNDNGIAYFDRMLKMLRDNGCFESDAEYNNVEVYISFTRKKLQFLASMMEIKAVRGLGYELRKKE